MKKKIKDLTFEELRKICKTHPDGCKDCPLITCTYGCMVNIESCCYEPYWEQEIEVDLDEEKN